jgi:hypothetical protein
VTANRVETLVVPTLQEVVGCNDDAEACGYLFACPTGLVRGADIRASDVSSASRRFSADGSSHRWPSIASGIGAGLNDRLGMPAGRPALDGSMTA